MTGGPNEVWSYGEEAYEIMCSYLELRERLRPYIAEQMATAAREGLPPMRPLFLEFPEDETAWTVADQFLLGPISWSLPSRRPARLAVRSTCRLEHAGGAHGRTRRTRAALGTHSMPHSTAFRSCCATTHSCRRSADGAGRDR